MSAFLIAENLACRRGARRLFRDIQFQVDPGEVVWIKGSNGRGKSSLLRLLAGIVAPDEGAVRLAQGAGRAFIGHANALKDDLTALENLQFMAGLRGLTTARPDLLSALQTLGLKGREHSPVRTFSQGQRRRVALARLALETSPGLWILDEPFDALDTSGTAVLGEVLSGHVARGGSVVLTSHLELSTVVPDLSPVREWVLGATA
jgi:heme exporter protein A